MDRVFVTVEGPSRKVDIALPTNRTIGDLIPTLVEMVESGSAPADGATVPSGSPVSVAATDNVGVTRVELWIDGTLAGTDTSAPYGFTLGALTAEQHLLQARAYDAANNVGLSSSVTVTISTASGPSEIVLYASEAPTRVGNWTVVSDSTAAGGARLRNPNVGGAKIRTASASPANYVELTFTAQASVPYHLWMRGQADSNNWANDSVFVQFSDAINSAGAPIYGIGTTSATEYNLEDCGGCGLGGWGWQDNGYAGMGVDITFGTSGTHTMRLQTREDGLSIDQIVLSPSRFLTTAPGALKNDSTILPKQ